MYKPRWTSGFLVRISKVEKAKIRYVECAMVLTYEVMPGESSLRASSQWIVSAGFKQPCLSTVTIEAIHKTRQVIL